MQSCNELKNSAIRTTLRISPSIGCWSALTEQLMCDWAECRCEQRLPAVVLDQRSAGRAVPPSSPPLPPYQQPNRRGLLCTLRAWQTWTCSHIGSGWAPALLGGKTASVLASPLSLDSFMTAGWLKYTEGFIPSHALQVLSERFPWKAEARAH